ncbi:MAG TPA: PAS domain-containing sensor histidine kinase [Spirochaetia bacterium]|nr:PAS domain-containing sensor histidine kinase [Spirochaetia bacterium]
MASTERVLDLLDSAPVGIFRVNLAGTLLDASPQFARALGFASRQELEEFAGIKGAHRLCDYFATLDEVLQLPTSTGWRQAEMPFRRRDGSNGFGRLCLRSAGDHAAADAKERVVQGLFVDLSELQSRHEASLRHWQTESLSRLSSAIGHHFNNLNTIIMGYIGVALRDQRLHPGVRPSLDAALRGAWRIQEITQRLQALRPCSLGDHVEIRLDEAAAGSLQRCALEARRSGVAVEWRLSSARPVVADARTVSFVLGVLVENSVHALRSLHGRPVMVSTGDETRRSFLRVSDRGCGIAAADVPRVFTPFFSRKGEWAPPGSSQCEIRGIGTSLAISRALVESLGGTIELESQENVGTTVTVWFPRA